LYSIYSLVPQLPIVHKPPWVLSTVSQNHSQACTRPEAVPCRSRIPRWYKGESVQD
jgi:hypothetical protein